MKQAEAIAKEAAENDAVFEYYLTYASILAVNGKKTEALQAANQSMELSKTEG